MNIHLLSWNCRGIMSSAFALSEMLDRNRIDIALLTEHKLLSRSNRFLNTIHSDYDYDCIVKIDDKVEQYGSLKCGKGGIAIMYKKCLSSLVSQVQFFESHRVCGIRIRCDNLPHLFIFYVYLPANNGIEYYNSVLNDVQSLVTYYTQVGSVLIGGDLNGQFKQGALRENGNTKSKLLIYFIIRNNLLSLQSVYVRHNEYTF